MADAEIAEQEAQGRRARKFGMGMPRAESGTVMWIRRVLLTLVTVHLVFAAWTIVRRLRQVFTIEVRSPAVLATGVTVGLDAITSGTSRNRLRLELVQGARTATLLEVRSPQNDIVVYDPRLFRERPRVHLTPELLAGFSPGPATLRATGFGNMQLLHVPGPRTHEFPVMIRP
jgi:hypothetical protein